MSSTSTEQSRYVVGAYRRGKLPTRHFIPIIADGKWGLALAELADVSACGAGGIALVLGNRGTGKTQLAVQVARQIIEEDSAKSPSMRPETPAAYTTAMEIFLAIKATYGSRDTTESTVIDRYTKPPLLIIDEVQERGETAWEDRLLTHIVDCRYGAMRPTIIIGNLLPAQLKDSLGESIVSRAKECGGLIVCDWPSFR